MFGIMKSKFFFCYKYILFYNRSSPIYTFEWGSDSVTTVKFNPVELDVFASCATDRSVILYDIRGNTPIRKLIMKVNFYFLVKVFILF